MISSHRRSWGRDRVLDGQLGLFGGICAQCGPVPAHVRVYRGKKYILCDVCGKSVVEDFACGCAGK
jgi:hypothetical protein